MDIQNEKRVRDIVRGRHVKSYTFAFPAWISSTLFVVSNKRTGFSLWRSNNKFGKSIKAESDCLWAALPGQCDADIYADMCSAIEHKVN